MLSISHRLRRQRRASTALRHHTLRTLDLKGLYDPLPWTPIADTVTRNVNTYTYPARSNRAVCDVGSHHLLFDSTVVDKDAYVVGDGLVWAGHATHETLMAQKLGIARSLRLSSSRWRFSTKRCSAKRIYNWSALMLPQTLLIFPHLVKSTTAPLTLWQSGHSFRLGSTSGAACRLPLRQI